MILAVCGPPASGKTTIATRVHEALCRTTSLEAGTDLRLLHSDDYSRYAYDRMHAEVTTTDAHFVLDGTFYKQAHQEPFSALPDVHFALVRADLDTCLRRDHARDGIGDKAVRVVHREFSDPPADVVIDTDILPVEDAVELLTERTCDWLGNP